MECWCPLLAIDQYRTLHLLRPITTCFGHWLYIFTSVCSSDGFCSQGGGSKVFFRDVGGYQNWGGYFYRGGAVFTWGVFWTRAPPGGPNSFGGGFIHFLGIFGQNRIGWYASYWGVGIPSSWIWARSAIVSNRTLHIEIGDHCKYRFLAEGRNHRPILFSVDLSLVLRFNKTILFLSTPLATSTYRDSSTSDCYFLACLKST